MGSCMKDKGNYTLSPINEIEISELSASQNIDLFVNDHLKLSPIIKQSNVTTENYSYLWYVFNNNATAGGRIDLSDKKDLDIVIRIPLGGYTLVFVVKDLTTGITTTKQINLNVVSRFSSGLVVLEEKAQGGDLSHIGFDGSIYRNLYTSANDGNYIPTPVGTLVGYFHRGGAQIQKPIYLYLSAPGKNTIELDPETYKTFGLFSKNIANGSNSLSELATLQCYYNATSIFAVVNKKILYGTSGGPIPIFEGELLGDYEVAPFIVTSTAGNRTHSPTITTNFVCYDDKNGRFLWFTAYGVSQLNTYSTDRSAPGAFDPNNVKKKCVFGGYSNHYAYFNWLMKDDADKMYYYQIYPISTQKAATAYAEIPVSAEMKDGTHFASSTELPHIYYVSGNKVMVYDYKANTAKVVYVPVGGEQITDLKLSLSMGSTTANLMRMITTTGKLYLATHNGTEGKVHEFGIAATGGLGEPVKTYAGFGKITSMFYKEKK